MKQILLASLFLLLSFSIFADNYSTGIGLTFGSSARGVFYGGNVKHFINDRSIFAVDLMVNQHLGDYVINGFFVAHKESRNSNRFVEYLNYFAGAGLGYNFTDDINRIKTSEKKSFFAPALLLGFEFKFPKTPLLMGFDAQPMINLVPDNMMYKSSQESYKKDFIQASVKLRYVF